MSVLVIGSGIAALSAIKAIRERRSEIPITLVTSESPPFYYRQMLPGLICKSRKAENLLQSADPAKSLKTEIIRGRVLSLDTETRRVRLTGGEAGYDVLLIASGGACILPDLPGINGGGVFLLRTIEDALGIRDAAERAEKVVVIGGGLPGVKTAEALLTMGKNVAVVEQRKLLLSPSADRKASEILAGRLRSAGIRIITGSKPVEIVRDGKRVQAVRLSDQEIGADIVIITVGDRPEIDFLKGSGIRHERGILTDERLQTSAPGVYAVGDVVEHSDAVYGTRSAGALWSNAREMGRIAGMNMSGGAAKYDGAISARDAADIAGLAFASIGRVMDEKNELETFSHAEGELYRKVLLDGDRVVGALFTGSLEGAGILANLIRNRMPIERSKALLAVQGKIGFSRLYEAAGR